MTLAVWVATSALVGAGLLALSAAVPVRDDEAWFLRVVDRCRTGEVLYRDLFYGAGPAPVWLALAAVTATRPQMLVVRALSVGYFVATLAAGTWLLHEVGAGEGAGPLVLWVAAIAFAGPTWSNPHHYTSLSMAASVAGAAGVAAWATGDGLGWLVCAGVACGANVASKHNVGLVATTALGIVVVAEGVGGAGVAAFAGGAAAGFVAPLLPVARQGALAHYVARAFVNKTTYLATGTISPLAGLRLALRGRRARPRLVAVASVVTGTTYAVLVAIAVAVVAAAFAAVDGDIGERGELAAELAVALGTVALAGAVPRTDEGHVRSIVPTALVALLLTVEAGSAAGWEMPDAVVAGAAVAGAAWTAVALVVALDPWHRSRAPGEPLCREVPHFRGLPVTRKPELCDTAALAAVHERTGGRVFLLRPDAAFWYLAADLTNPTPYDYPYASTFGPRGQAETIERIRSGEVAWVCSPGPISGPLAPAELEAFVAEAMVPVDETAAGTLYRVSDPA